MEDKIHKLRNDAIAEITSAESVAELEGLRIALLGRNGSFNELTKVIPSLEETEKRNVGRLLNEARVVLEEAIKYQIDKLNGHKRTVLDTTIPGLKPQLGNLHLVTQSIEEISRIFEKIGFVRVRYPEVEWDWFAFEALNMPSNEPARDEWETFFVDVPESKNYGKMLLTPHTSSGQIREMQRVKTPPIRMINIAKNHRRQSDATHNPMFHQFEGLVVDKGINITHLKGTLDYFTKAFYGANSVFRIRPHHFRFTEPSFEVDFSCVHCERQGCKFCKSGWLEVGGAGMVHPNVLKAGGIDPNEYSGFAFGWGVERSTLIRPGAEINDIRTLYSTDLRVLKQY